MRPGMNDHARGGPEGSAGQGGRDDPGMRAFAQRLRELPSETAPPFDWPEFRRRWDEHRRTRAAGWHAGWRRVALAAGFALIVAFVALWGRLDSRGTGSNHSTPTVAGSPDRADVQGAHPHGAPSHDASQSEAPSPITADDAASRWLASHPSEPAIVRVDTRLAVVDLEDRIAWIDDLLTAVQLDQAQPAQIVALRRERAQLVDSLAQVRYAETLASQLP